MGVIKFPDHVSAGHVHNQAPSNPHYNAITEVPGPGTNRKSRSRKRLSPAAVIARSLAPDATGLSPTQIIARSVENAFGAITHTRPAQKKPPHPAYSPTHQPAPEDDPFSQFWNVWMTHHDYLFKQSMRFMSGNLADAEDALSHAMLKGSQHFDSQQIRNERAWLTRLVHNACMDQHRSHKRQQRLSEETNPDDCEEAPALMPQPMRTPFEALHMTQVFRELEKQLKALPLTLLEPFMLRVIEDRSYDDIAERLGLSNCAVRKRIQLARDRLRKADWH